MITFRLRERVKRLDTQGKNFFQKMYLKIRYINNTYGNLCTQLDALWEHYEVGDIDPSSELTDTHVVSIVDRPSLNGGNDKGPHRQCKILHHCSQRPRTKPTDRSEHYVAYMMFQPADVSMPTRSLLSQGFQ